MIGVKRSTETEGAVQSTEDKTQNTDTHKNPNKAQTSQTSQTFLRLCFEDFV